MKRSSIDEHIRAANPVRDEDVDTWLRSPASSRARTSAMGAGVDGVPVRRSSRRPVRLVGLAAALVLILGAATGAAVVLLGEPAPPAVQRDLQGVDAGFPADLRYNPDVEHARSVAVSANAALFVADLKDGGHCTEMVVAGVPRGAVCTTGQQVGTEPIEVTIPFTDPVTTDSPVTIAGRVNVPEAASVEIRYADGGSDPVPLGTDGYFVFEVPAAHLGSAHGADFSLVALDLGGSELATVDVPAVAPEPAGPVEDDAPITVDTISDGSDLTKVLGVRGVVHAAGATSLELVYPDGTTVAVPLADDGSYDVDLPADRQGDLLHAVATLVARDGTGQEVASAPVASVAFWRAHGGQP